jgi:hypothetical protein
VAAVTARVLWRAPDVLARLPGGGRRRLGGRLGLTAAWVAGRDRVSRRLRLATNPDGLLSSPPAATS